MTQPYVFQPYDVLQVERNGNWLDFSTLRTKDESRLAVSYCNSGRFDDEVLNFRIVRRDVVVYQNVNPKW